MGATKAEKPFDFKQFSIQQDCCAMKVGTDGILLGAWAPTEDAGTILDIGTGTGLIAIMLAQRRNQATIHAVEVEESAYSEATQNIAACPWSERLLAFHAAIQDFDLPTSIAQGYDLIVSNPPFFSGGTFSFNQDRNSVRHTVKLPHNDLLRAVRRLLHENGKFCTILPLIEGLRFQELAESYNLYCTRQVEVKPRPPKPTERLLLTFGKEKQLMKEESLVLQEEGSNLRMPAYKALTEAFYLNP